MNSDDKRRTVYLNSPPLLKACEEPGHTDAQSIGDDPQALQRQVLPTPLHRPHKIPVEPAGVGKRLLRKAALFAQPSDARAELDLELVHFQ